MAASLAHSSSSKTSVTRKRLSLSPKGSRPPRETESHLKLAAPLVDTASASGETCWVGLCAQEDLRVALLLVFRCFGLPPDVVPPVGVLEGAREVQGGVRARKVDAVVALAWTEPSLPLRIEFAVGFTAGRFSALPWPFGSIIAFRCP